MSWRAEIDGKRFSKDDRDRSQFPGYLAEGAQRYRVKVHCYVLMRPNRGQPLTYDLSVCDYGEGCHDLLALSLPVRSTTSGRGDRREEIFGG